MTIGPERRMRSLWMSSRRGIRRSLAQSARFAARTRPGARSRGGRWSQASGAPDGVEEAVELVERVVGAGAGLRVVLDRRAVDLQQLQPLHRAGVEGDVGEGGLAEAGAPAHGLVGLDAAGAVGRLHGEAMVLRGDLDLAGPQV